LAEERVQELLLTIARCPNVRECVENRRKGHPCAEIVGVQKRGIEDRQLPEPWSGDLGKAPLLFLGSNPAFSEAEEFPRGSWPDEEVVDFFAHRFGGGRKPYVTDGLHVLQENGLHRPEWIRAWAVARKRAAELLGKRDPLPGVDYALSDVVHCKSRSQKGVKSALEECSARYLESLVERSGARAIVCLGKVASDAVRRKWKVPYDYRVHGPEEVGGSLRYFAFLSHPASYGPSGFGELPTREEIRGLQLFLGVGPSG
jgi:hypothetical protein